MYPDSLDFALLLSRVWIAVMIFMHGWRHVKAIRSVRAWPTGSRASG